MFKITHDFGRMSAQLEQAVRQKLPGVTAAALSETAFQARKAVQAKMKEVFRSPEAITLNSVLVKKADPNVPIGEMQATVFIRDHLSGGIAPAKYLLTEEKGGARVQKRSERVLQAAGALHSQQLLTPGPGAPLDAHGQLRGSAMVQILSRVKAFGEGGFTANANDKTRLRIIRAARSYAAKMAREGGASKAEARAAGQRAFTPITKSGTDFFLAKSKHSDGFMGIFQLVSRGKVRPVVWFSSRVGSYRAIFHFREVVARTAHAAFNKQMERAIRHQTKASE